MIYTAEQLREMHCQEPGCDHVNDTELYFHGRCHPESPTWAKFTAGLLVIECAVCDKVVAAVEVV